MNPQPETITLIGKGPSAVHAAEWIDACAWTDIAVINDAASLFEDPHHIDFCFFTDVELIERARDHWERCSYFVCPDELHRATERVPGLTVNDIAGLPHARCEQYPYHVCNGLRDAIESRIREGRVVHHHTATAAHSWLALNGYQKIRVIGCDGGSGYAANLSGTLGDWDFNGWREIHERLADVLHELIGTETEWYA